MSRSQMYVVISSAHLLRAFLRFPYDDTWLYQIIPSILNGNLDEYWDIMHEYLDSGIIDGADGPVDRAVLTLAIEEVSKVVLRVFKPKLDVYTSTLISPQTGILTPIGQTGDFAVLVMHSVDKQPEISDGTPTSNE